MNTMNTMNGKAFDYVPETAENNSQKSAPCEDRTHDLQISDTDYDYETDALPTALTRHLQGQVEP